MKTRSKVTLLFVLSFLDFLSFSAVLPFLPLFFLKTPHSFLNEGASHSIRNLLFCLLLLTYPAAQALFTPLLGHLSDKIGRKKILSFAYLGNTVGYISCAMGSLTASVAFFFVGNAIAGCVGANLTMVNSLISDHFYAAKRSKMFGLSYLFIFGGFALGSYLSSWLLRAACPPRDMSFFAFLVCSFVSLFSFLVYSSFIDNSWLSAHLLKAEKVDGLKIKSLFKAPGEARRLFLGSFCLLSGWYSFVKVLQIFLIESLACSEVELFKVFAAHGLFCFLTQFFFLLPLSKQVMKLRGLVVVELLFAAAILSFYFVKSYIHIFPSLLIVSMTYALSIPALTYFVSEVAGKEERGRVMGLHQTVAASSKILAPLISFLLLLIHVKAVIIGSTLLLLSSAWVFYLLDQLRLSTSSRQVLEV